MPRVPYQIRNRDDQLWSLTRHRMSPRVGPYTAKLSRQPHSKSRLGCRNCKRRKVKVGSHINPPASWRQTWPMLKILSSVMK